MLQSASRSWGVGGLPKGAILIISDDEHVRAQIEQSLNNRGFRIVNAGSADEGVRRALADKPNLICLDADMATSNATLVCQELRKNTFVPIILLGSRSDETDVVFALGMGADYYLVKPFRNAELAAYAEAAIRRETLYCRLRTDCDIVRIKDLVLDFCAHELRRNGRPISLSPTEFRLVEMLAKNAGRTMSRDQLLDSVWELKADGIYSRTIDVHIGRIRRKIGDNPLKPRYIVTVPGFGYKMVSD